MQTILRRSTADKYSRRCKASSLIARRPVCTPYHLPIRLECISQLPVPGRACRPVQTTPRASYPIAVSCIAAGRWVHDQPTGKETLPLVPDSTPIRTPRSYGPPPCLFRSSRPRHLPVLELLLKCQT